MARSRIPPRSPCRLVAEVVIKVFAKDLASVSYAAWLTVGFEAVRGETAGRSFIFFHAFTTETATPRIIKSVQIGGRIWRALALCSRGSRHPGDDLRCHNFTEMTGPDKE